MRIGDKYIITQHAVDHACIREDLQEGDEIKIVSFDDDKEMYLGVCHETGVEEIFGGDDVDEGYLIPAKLWGLARQHPKEDCSPQVIQETLTHHMEDSGEYDVVKSPKHYQLFPEYSLEIKDVNKRILDNIQSSEFDMTFYEAGWYQQSMQYFERFYEKNGLEDLEKGIQTMQFVVDSMKKRK